MDKKLNEAVAALRPQMVAALQRLVRRRSVEADPLPGRNVSLIVPVSLRVPDFVPRPAGRSAHSPGGLRGP